MLEGKQTFNQGDRIEIFFKTNSTQKCVFISFNYAGMFILSLVGESFYIPYSSIEKVRLDG
jgi:hypothetical protein